MKQTERYRLGELELKDSVYVSDPCYDPGTWCQALIDNLKPGKYIGYMKKADFGPGCFGGIRVTDIWIIHSEHPHLYPIKILDPGIDIGVDSGAAGIYDSDYYEKYHTPELNEDWYDKQFDLRYYFDMDGNNVFSETSKVERRDGIELDGKCVISFSGFGDGGYELYARKDKAGKIIGLRINFINTHEEDEE
jgi:hypothetical protein